MQVKICGLTRREDAEHVAAVGADLGGVILAPGGKRSVTPETAALLFAELPLRRVGVFVNATLSELRSAAEIAALDVLQLHGDEAPELVEELRALGQWTIWKAIRPRGAGDFVEAVSRYAPVVDGLLLDGWSAEARGGTGHRFPWEAVAPHRHRLPSDVSLIVAGGLSPQTVGQARSLLRPSAVDVSSGVEVSPGIKDARAVSAFVEAARAPATDSVSSDV